MSAYYNENDPYVAQWLRNLIEAKHIAPGDVDERSIEDVRPNELTKYTQHHFFAGIGVWSYALRLAGWSDDQPVWTGSCPCQPFSAAGQGKGTADERHLWPAWFHLIRKHRPSVIFGEQVASKAGLAWFDLVQSDLEGEGYACGPVNLPACGVGAPHLRQRSWFVADRKRKGLEVIGQQPARQEQSTFERAGNGQAGELADLPRDGRGEERSNKSGGGERGSKEGRAAGYDASSNVGELGNTTSARYLRQIEATKGQARDKARMRVLGEASGASSAANADHSLSPRRERAKRDTEGGKGEAVRVDPSSEAFGWLVSGPTHGFWGAVDWLFCRDGKWRPVEPGTFPLVNGTSARVGRLRAYGNAIVPQVAAEVIRAYMELERG